MQTCPFCFTQLPEGASVCIACNARYGLPLRSNTGQMLSGIFIMLAIAGGLACCGRMGKLLGFAFVLIAVLWLVQCLHDASKKKWWRRE